MKYRMAIRFLTTADVARERIEFHSEPGEKEYFSGDFGLIYLAASRQVLWDVVYINARQEAMRLEIEWLWLNLH